jgi:cephalosporin hydroxylase
LTRLRLPSRNVTRVQVIDDGDHTTTPLLVHFHHLARLVTNGSYYLVQDTRLDRNCRAQKEIIRTGVWSYCRNIIGRDGGPARAVAVLANESDLFRRLGFRVDRSPERYVYTQHPGGWLKRDG